LVCFLMDWRLLGDRIRKVSRSPSISPLRFSDGGEIQWVMAVHRREGSSIDDNDLWDLILAKGHVSIRPYLVWNILLLFSTSTLDWQCQIMANAHYIQCHCHYLAILGSMWMMKIVLASFEMAQKWSQLVIPSSLCVFL